MCSKNRPVTEENQSGRSKSNRVRVNKRKIVSDGESKLESMKKSSSVEQIRRSSRIKKRKKPKFLSLKLELISSDDKNGEKKQSSQKKKKTKKAKPKTTPFGKQSKTKQRKEGIIKEKQQLNLFPVHPESGYQYDAVTEYLFNSSAADTSIHDLLDSTVTTSEDGPILSPYHNSNRHGGPGSSSSASSLVRTAMRRGASSQETTEERWVSYSEVVEEAVLSRSGTPRCGGGAGVPPSSLALKLDYDGIMEAWSDKGTLYIDGEPPQTVPDLHADQVVMDGGMGNVWAVPEMETAECWKKGQREASLLRYKEKRQSRLFAKRIRYEVRKLNAEKRPRIKGRFVKRVET